MGFDYVHVNVYVYVHVDVYGREQGVRFSEEEMEVSIMAVLRKTGFATALILALAACGPTQPPAASRGDTAPSAPAGAKLSPAEAMAKLYERAKAEGQIVWHLATADWARYIDAFKAAYPGIEVSTVEKASPAMTTQIVTEASRGRPSVDVAMGNMADILPAADRNLISSVDWPGLGVPPEDVSADGRYVIFYDFPFGMAYNPSFLPAADVPRTWEDLLAPKWKGNKISVHTVNASALALLYVWDKERVVTYLQKLHDQELVALDAGFKIRELVLRGEVLIGDHFVHSTFRLKEQGQPLDAVPLGPSATLPFGGYVVKDAPHPNAGTLFLAWLMTSPESKQIHKELRNDKARPCNASTLAQYMCDKKLDIIYIDTPEKVRVFNDYKKVVADILVPIR